MLHESKEAKGDAEGYSQILQPTTDNIHLDFEEKAHDSFSQVLQPKPTRNNIHSGHGEKAHDSCSQVLQPTKDNIHLDDDEGAPDSKFISLL
eukprot:gene10495-11594_t